MLVNVMCPADGLTPSGTECGLAIYMDRQLAGDFGKGGADVCARTLDPGQASAGLSTATEARGVLQGRHRGGARRCADALWKIIRSASRLPTPTHSGRPRRGKVTDSRLSLADWFSQLGYPLFQQACFADPVYGGNRNKVFWKAIGYPGLPAFHAQNMVQYPRQAVSRCAGPEIDPGFQLTGMTMKRTSSRDRWYSSAVA